MPDPVVDVQQLSRSYGRTQALKQVDLLVRPGQVYGLVGANGAGKTTLIKHLLGLLRAQQGQVRVFNRDPVREPVPVLQQIGYLSEQRDLPEWMRVDELLRYTRAFHPGWDADYAAELLDTFGLDPSKKIKELSKGMRAQAGLIAAVAHRPQLLLLDEPSTGLDALVRRDILNAIIRAVADDGRTAIFSSHLLEEVQLMSDRIVMIDAGQILLDGTLDDLLECHHTFVVDTRNAPIDLVNLPGVLSSEDHGPHSKLVCEHPRVNHEELLANGAQIIQARGATLTEIFVARAGRTQVGKMQQTDEVAMS